MPDKTDHILTDIRLLALIKTGDRHAFEIIYNKYWSRLYLSAFNLLRDAQACEDIIQDIFVQLWLRRESVAIGCLSSYLHTAVRYQVFNLIRSGKANQFSIEQVTEPASSENIDDLLTEKDLNNLLNERVYRPKNCRESTYYRDPAVKTIHEGFFMLAADHLLSGQLIFSPCFAVYFKC